MEEEEEATNECTFVAFFSWLQQEEEEAEDSSKIVASLREIVFRFRSRLPFNNNRKQVNLLYSPTLKGNK